MTTGTPMTRLCTALLLLAGLTGIAAPAAAGEAAPGADTDYGRMILVLDSSGSMKEPVGDGTTKIGAARQALGQVVEELPEAADVGLRVFGAQVFSREDRGACTDSQLVVEPGTDNRDELRDAIADYQPFGETPIAHALKEAADDIGSEGSRSIVLVSDGIATCDPDPCEVAADLAERGIDLQIDVVGLSVDPAARSQLRCIAAQGNGTYYDADSSADIVESLDTAATRAVRPFELEGQPIDGGTELRPTPVEVGQWVDEVGADGPRAERWFRFERTIPGSTVHVSVASLGQADGAFDGVTVTLQPEGGGTCGSDADTKTVISSELIGVGESAGPEDLDEACTEEPLLVTVSRSLGGVDSAAPFSLKVVEEPPVVESERLPEGLSWGGLTLEMDSPQGRAEPVVGGSSFGTATEIEPGLFRGTIVPGETQAFRVPVDYGQTLSARVVTPPASDSLLEEFGVLGPYATVKIYTPMRQQVSATGRGVSPTGQATGAGVGEMATMTPEVRYRSREEAVNSAYLAGDYYVVYAADRDSDGAAVEMPFRLQVEVTGEPSGQPAYADAATVRAGEASADPESTLPVDEPGTEDAREQAAGSAGPGTGRVALASGLGLVAVLALAMGVLLLRRSRQQ